MEKGFWTRIGTAFQNQDGSWNLRFDYLPSDPTVTIQIHVPRVSEEAAQSAPAVEPAKATCRAGRLPWNDHVVDVEDAEVGGRGRASDGADEVEVTGGRCSRASCPPGQGVGDLAGDGALTIVSYHDSSGLDQAKRACRVAQTHQIFAHPGNGSAARGESHNFVLGDLNTDPGRLAGPDESAARWLESVDPPPRERVVASAVHPCASASPAGRPRRSPRRGTKLTSPSPKHNFTSEARAGVSLCVSDGRAGSVIIAVDRARR